ncbi:YggS family pyridoxal phosphate-dependent enzyme [candidate division GN15 bacterium]|nr:YggS family pyridoxal phosphate-dependent enzyme [candidate division GN15 bacterium]
MKDDITANLTELRGRLAEACEEYDRDVDDITLVAVTKTHPASIIHTAVAAGLTEIGESRVQEAEPKIKEVGHVARYHMIGHLQTNKAKKAVELFDVIQSVDSLKLAEEISRRASEIERTIECLVEINVSGETSKYGAPPEEAVNLIKQVHGMPGVKLTGVMTIGPLTDDEDDIREAFARCREIFKQGRDIVGDDFDCLSMGMSEDFPLAIAEGSTMIRVGTGIFGPRQTR